MQNFEDVYHKDTEFLQLGVEELCELLESDQLNVADEKIVFHAVCRWIDADPRQRKVHVSRLLRTVRLGLLSTEFFVQTVLPHPYVRLDKGAREVARDTLRFLNDTEPRPGEDQTGCSENPLARPRVPRDVLFVLGGWMGDCPTNVVEAYDSRADNWTVCDKPDPTPRAYHGAAAVGSRIYVLGGFDGARCLNSCRVFDAAAGTWSKAPRMHHRRCYVSVAAHEGLVYAMGGYDGEVWKKSAECYDPSQHEWTRLPAMLHQRSDAGATALGDKIYICGGFDGTSCLDSAEVYSPESGQWTLIPPMPKRRSGVGVIAYHGQVYVLGGFNGSVRKATGKRYDPEKAEWSRVPEMYTPRSNFATAVVDDQLFAVGGYSWDGGIPSVECYDFRTDEWLDATDLSLPRSAMCACVVSGLPNVYDYIYRRPAAVVDVRAPSPDKPSTSAAPPGVAAVASPQVGCPCKGPVAENSSSGRQLAAAATQTVSEKSLESESEPEAASLGNAAPQTADPCAQPQTSVGVRGVAGASTQTESRSESSAPPSQVKPCRVKFAPSVPTPRERRKTAAAQPEASPTLDKQRSGQADRSTVSGAETPCASRRGHASARSCDQRRVRSSKAHSAVHS